MTKKRTRYKQQVWPRWLVRVLRAADQKAARNDSFGEPRRALPGSVADCLVRHAPFSTDLASRIGLTTNGVPRQELPSSRVTTTLMSSGLLIRASGQASMGTWRVRILASQLGSAICNAVAAWSWCRRAALTVPKMT